MGSTVPSELIKLDVLSDRVRHELGDLLPPMALITEGWLPLEDSVEIAIKRIKCYGLM